MTEPAPGAGLDDLPPANENRALADPRPRPWDRVAVSDDDRTIRVAFSYGNPLRFHHAEAAARPDAVVVTIFVGTPADIAERMARGEQLYFTMQMFSERAEIVLDEPVGGRPIVDGANT